MCARAFPASLIQRGAVLCTPLVFLAEENALKQAQSSLLFSLFSDFAFSKRTPVAHEELVFIFLSTGDLKLPWFSGRHGFL